MLSNMFPCFSAQNLPNIVWGRSHVCGNFSPGFSTCPPLANKDYITGGEYRVSMLLPARTPTLHHHIGRILSLSAEPKVVWIYTWARIAAMEDKHAARNRADEFDIRSSMRQDIFGFCARWANTISICVDFITPKPTPRIRFGFNKRHNFLSHGKIFQCALKRFFQVHTMAKTHVMGFANPLCMEWASAPFDRAHFWGIKSVSQSRSPKRNWLVARQSLRTRARHEIYPNMRLIGG